ncbi:microfibril-associated glycoprotein 4-like [Mytilus edulis]|uniref:microfibril-associated glycoprotein 4-like n=1 Tax=Mytilus edulis TaxID=6550 RepID=UPI0039EFAD18
MVVWSVLLLTVFVVSHSFADNFNNKKCQPGVTFHGDTADKILELLSNSGGSKQNRKSNNSNEKPEKDKGPCSGVTFHGDTADKILELLSNSGGSKQNRKSNNSNEKPEKDKGPCSVKRPSDCGDLEKSTCKSGIYKIYPEKTSTFDVFCEMEKHGGGWTVFQRRMNGKINFFRKWESYKTGFGNLNGEHWLGNEHLHKLTSHGKYSLRIDMSDFKNNHRHAVYNKFFVGSESAGYKLDVTGYSGDAGDSMAVHQNGKKFTTIDKDQDAHGENCAKYYKGGWWYGACHQCNLNGLYLKGSSTYGEGINWYTWKGLKYSLKTTTMMIRRS